MGELLDPINDAVERFSSVMVWAIGSLVLQRIFLEVASSSAFKWIFFGIGLMAITTSLLGTWQRLRDLFGAWDGFSDLFVRLFIYVAVFRFIVPVFAIISFLVGQLLFDAEINKNKEELSMFSEEISVDTSTPAPGTQEFEEEQVLKTSELAELRQRMASYIQETEALDAQIQELSGGAGLRRYLPESLGGLPADEQRALTPSGLPELDELLQTHGVLTQDAEALDGQIRELSGGAGLRRYLPESLGGLPADEQRALTPSGLPELDELLQTHGVLTQDAEALDARIQELRNEVGLRRYLPESLGGVSPGEKLAAAEARREEIRLEVEAIESRVRAMETEQLASAEARREEIRLEVEAIESRVRAMETEQLASAEARREEISREMETADSQIRAVEEELECIEKRRAGEDCVSLLGKLSAMGQEGYARIRDLIGKAGEIVTTVVKLTIIIIVKNMLLPIAFLMIAVKYALPVARYWARLTSDFRRDVKEFRNTLSPDVGNPLLKEKPEGA